VSDAAASAENARATQAAGPAGAGVITPTVVVIPPVIDHIWLKRGMSECGTLAFGALNFLFTLVFLAPVVVVVAPIFVVRLLRQSRRNAAREAWLRAHNPWQPTVLSWDLMQLWCIYDELPATKVIRAFVQRYAEALEATARSVVLYSGTSDPPPVGDYRFEPVVVRSAELSVRRIVLIQVCVFLAALAAILALNIRFNFGLVGESLGALIAILGMLFVGFWLRGMRPCYLRVAPRMVQVLRYPALGQRPTIHEYPLAAGTVIVLSSIDCGLHVLLSRRTLEDRVGLSRRQASATLDDLWRALLSTAPTPPLPDDALVG
jgi:hypothetical protein